MLKSRTIYYLFIYLQNAWNKGTYGLLVLSNFEPPNMPIWQDFELIQDFKPDLHICNSHFKISD